MYSGKLDFTGVTTVKMTYDKNNRLLTYNGEKIKYDKDGNMTYGPLQGRMTEFAFDCRNRLVKAGDTSYEYDAENNRIAVTTGTKRTEYVVNSQPELSQVLQSTIIEGKKKETTYYFYEKGLISQENKAGGYLTYHFNNVGSTMAVTNQKGEVVKEYAYSPYGELLLGESDGSIPFLYNGQFGVTTDANGLYYMRARYYNVDIKRFINQDVLTGTLERISSLNRYAYVEGNPVSFLDPFGLEPYDTTTLHLAAGALSILGGKLSEGGLVVAGALVSALANGFDIGLNLYDMFYSIRDGDWWGVLGEVGSIVIDLVGIITAGISSDIFFTAEYIAKTEKIAYGYENMLSLKYDNASYLFNSSGNGGNVSFLVTLAKKVASIFGM